MTIRNSNTYDNLLLLKDAGAVTASGAGTVGGTPRVLDLGDGHTEAKVIIESAAIDTTSGDETYRASLQGCNDPAFGSNVVELGSTLVSAVGRAEAHFTTQVGGVNYRYVRLYTTAGGTTPSLNATAFIAKY